MSSNHRVGHDLGSPGLGDTFRRRDSGVRVKSAPTPRVSGGLGPLPEEVCVGMVPSVTITITHHPCPDLPLPWTPSPRTRLTDEDRPLATRDVLITGHILVNDGRKFTRPGPGDV